MRIKEKINKKKRNKPRRTFKSYEAYKLSTLMEKCFQMALKCEIEAFIELQPLQVLFYLHFLFSNC